MIGSKSQHHAASTRDEKFTNTDFNLVREMAYQETVKATSAENREDQALS